MLLKKIKWMKTYFLLELEPEPVKTDRVRNTGCLYAFALRYSMYLTPPPLGVHCRGVGRFEPAWSTTKPWSTTYLH